MMHRAWSSIEEVPYCFWRSSVKFQGHIALKIVEFDPNWAFPDCNSSFNSPMAMKCCTKLETAKKRCPIFFQGHPSNFKVTLDKTSPILTQIGHFRTIGRSQLSNPSDLPCCSTEDQIHNIVTLHAAYLILSIPCLLMPWRLKAPGHQRAWYWSNKLQYSMSSIRRVKIVHVVDIFHRGRQNTSHRVNIMAADGLIYLEYSGFISRRV